MARTAVIWAEGDRLVVRELPQAGEGLIGRTAGSAVTLDHSTVSRQHARLRSTGGVVQLEHLSRTNLTRVNDAPVEGSATLADRDKIQVGPFRLVFHDLSSGDRISGPICSHCGRENTAGDRYCWFCGTAMVSAHSGLRQKRPVVCRLAAADGEGFDLYADDTLVFGPDGTGEVRRADGLPEGAVAAVKVKDGKPVLLTATGQTGVTVNGEAGADGQALRTGDEIRSGATRLAVIVR